MCLKSMGNRSALRDKTNELTEKMSDWMKNKLIYHARVDHGYVMPPEMAHNLAVHLVLAQLETMLRVLDGWASLGGDTR
jgi:hypothetical protein